MSTDVRVGWGLQGREGHGWGVGGWGRGGGSIFTFRLLAMEASPLLPSSGRGSGKPAQVEGKGQFKGPVGRYGYLKSMRQV